jgi:pyruvate kinase
MKSLRRTKVVATVGPATASADVLRRLIAAGADCLRFNFSHDRAEAHVARIRAARRAARDVGRTVAVLADLCGPKIRSGPAPEAGVRLETGALVEIVPGSQESTPEHIWVSYPRLAREVRRGQRILLADGRMELVVERVSGGRIAARVRIGGLLGARKGVNLPGAELSAPAMTPKDRRDLAAAAAVRPDIVALSFVRRPEDLAACRSHMRRLGLASSMLIAKIEMPQALENIDGILEAADGIMVARGDLGVELSPEEVPAAQRRLVALAAARDRLCIVATEMFESMISSTRPTRAEVSDVATAVMQGADAVMLSAETSIGRHPVEAVGAMCRVLASAEASLVTDGGLAVSDSRHAAGGLSDAMALAAQLAGGHLGGDVVYVAATESGRTALYLSKSRPTGPILGMSRSREALARMALFWGVLPVPARRFRQPGQLLEAAGRAAARCAGAAPGGHAVILSGTPLGVSGLTNTLHVRRLK